MKHSNRAFLLIACMSLHAAAFEPVAIVDGSRNNFAVEITSDGSNPLVLCALHNNVVTRSFDNQIVAQYTGHTGAITALARDYNQSKFASGSADGTVRIWDTRSGRESQVIYLGNQATQISWDKAGDYLMVYDWGNRGVLADTRGRSQKIFDQEVPNSCIITSASLTPDAKTAILGYMMDSATPSVVALYDAVSGETISQVTIENNADIFEVKADPNGRYFAIGDAGNNVYLADMHNQNRVKNLSHGFSRSITRPLSALVFDNSNKDIQYLAGTGFADGEIGVWDLEALELVKTFKAPSQGTAIAWSVCGKYVASAHIDGKNRVWAVK